MVSNPVSNRRCEMGRSAYGCPCLSFFQLHGLNCDMATALPLANIQFLLSLLEPADEDVSRMSLSTPYDLSLLDYATSP